MIGIKNLLNKIRFRNKETPQSLFNRTFKDNQVLSQEEQRTLREAAKKNANKPMRT